MLLVVPLQVMLQLAKYDFAPYIFQCATMIVVAPGDLSTPRFSPKVDLDIIDVTIIPLSLKNIIGKTDS